MNLDLDKLGCGHSDLLDFLYILKRVKPTHVYVLALHGDLVLSTTTLGGGNSIDQVTIKVPYTGKKGEGFVTTREFSNALQSTQGVLVFETTDKPKGWHSKLPSRPRELQDLDAKALHKAMEYLLRVTHEQDHSWHAGLIFSKGEIAATDGKRIHIDNSLPNMIEFDQEDEFGSGDDYRVETAPGRALMGLGAASALMRATRLMPNAKVVGGHQHSDARCSGFVFELKYGKTRMSITSRPWIQTKDTKNARPRGDESNIAFTVYADHLETVLKYALRQQNKTKRAFSSTVLLTYTENLSELEVVIKTKFHNEHGVHQTKEEGTHQLLCSAQPSTTNYKYWVELDSTFLLEAIKGMGDSIQLILPAHPVDGLQHCYINPVYVTGQPGRFAVLAPHCEPETVSQALEERRAIDSGTHHNYCR